MSQWDYENFRADLAQSYWEDTRQRLGSRQRPDDSIERANRNPPPRLSWGTEEKCEFSMPMAWTRPR